MGRNAPASRLCEEGCEADSLLAHPSGITIPIIPGIMPIHNYQSFRRMTNLCKARVPQEVLDGLEPIRVSLFAVPLCFSARPLQPGDAANIALLHQHSLTTRRSRITVCNSAST